MWEFFWSVWTIWTHNSTKKVSVQTGIPTWWHFLLNVHVISDFGPANWIPGPLLVLQLYISSYRFDVSFKFITQTKPGFSTQISKKSPRRGAWKGDTPSHTLPLRPILNHSRRAALLTPPPPPMWGKTCIAQTAYSTFWAKMREIRAKMLCPPPPPNRNDPVPLCREVSPP